MSRRVSKPRQGLKSVQEGWQLLESQSERSRLGLSAKEESLVVKAYSLQNASHHKQTFENKRRVQFHQHMLRIDPPLFLICVLAISSDKVKYTKNEILDKLVIELKKRHQHLRLDTVRDHCRRCNLPDTSIVSHERHPNTLRSKCDDDDNDDKLVDAPVVASPVYTPRKLTRDALHAPPSADYKKMFKYVHGYYDHFYNPNHRPRMPTEPEHAGYLSSESVLAPLACVIWSLRQHLTMFDPDLVDLSSQSNDMAVVLHLRRSSVKDLIKSNGQYRGLSLDTLYIGPGCVAIIPWCFSETSESPESHWILFVAEVIRNEEQPETADQLRLAYYDSNYTADDEVGKKILDQAAKVRGMLATSKWFEHVGLQGNSIDPPEVPQLVYIRSPQQTDIAGDGHCGIYVILNGWVAALRLTVNPNFKSTRKFLEAGIAIFNRAVTGNMDSATIFMFLRSYGYITAEDRFDDTRLFTATVNLTEPLEETEIRATVVESQLVLGDMVTLRMHYLNELQSVFASEGNLSESCSITVPPLSQVSSSNFQTQNVKKATDMGSPSTASPHRRIEPPNSPSTKGEAVHIGTTGSMGSRQLRGQGSGGLSLSGSPPPPEKRQAPSNLEGRSSTNRRRAATEVHDVTSQFEGILTNLVVHDGMRSLLPESACLTFDPGTSCPTDYYEALCLWQVSSRRKKLGEKQRCVVVPLNVNDNHWVLVHIDRAQRSVSFHDSYIEASGLREDTARVIAHKLIFALGLKDEDKARSFDIAVLSGIQQAVGSNACGIYTIVQAFYNATGKSFPDERTIDDCLAIWRHLLSPGSDEQAIRRSFVSYMLKQIDEKDDRWSLADYVCDLDSTADPWLKADPGRDLIAYDKQLAQLYDTGGHLAGVCKSIKDVLDELQAMTSSEEDAQTRARLTDTLRILDAHFHQPVARMQQVIESSRTSVLDAAAMSVLKLKAYFEV